MKKDYSKIINNKLFDNITEADFYSMLSCLGAFERKYSKREVILNEGDSINFVGAVLSGEIKIVKTDFDGNEMMMGKVSDGDIFAEVFACAEVHHSPVSIISMTESTVLFFDFTKITSSCCSSCKFHQQLITNMLSVVAKKALYLNKRIDIISKKTLRDKILSYFHQESHGLKKFTISMNRENLANFLCADRSALSNELSKMKKDGLIDYSKNEFELFI